MSGLDRGVRISGQSAALPAPRARQARAWNLRSPWFGGSVYVVVFCLSALFVGVPMTRDQVFVWLLLGMLALSLSDLQIWLRGIVVDWVPVFGVLFVYDLLRGYADDLSASAHVFPQMHADEWLFGGTTPTVLLQQRFFTVGDPRWWDFAAWFIYMSHFFVALGVAAVLWKVAHHRFRRFMAMFLALTLAGFATYVVIPAVPPWLASRNGDLEPTTRLILSMWDHLGVEKASAVFSGGNRYANDVAALPSLHGAYPALLMLYFWRESQGWMRAALVAYPILMCITLVYAAEHYVVDVLMGWAYAGAVFVATMAILRRHRRRLPASPVVEPLARVV